MAFVALKVPRIESGVIFHAQQPFAFSVFNMVLITAKFDTFLALLNTFYKNKWIYLCYSCIIAVHVFNLNDEKPSFTASLYNLTLRENNMKDRLIGAVNATDPDGDQLTFAFQNATQGILLLWWLMGPKSSVELNI